MQTYSGLSTILFSIQIYSRIALWITDLELHRTQTEYDEALALKTYLLQCINFYSSILYIAIFKGKFTGHPWDYNRLLGGSDKHGQRLPNAYCFAYRLPTRGMRRWRLLHGAHHADGHNLCGEAVCSVAGRVLCAHCQEML